ncbi:MAG: hypothetical protein AAF658_18960, partial [Myxococcota bacterium]
MLVAFVQENEITGSTASSVFTRLDTERLLDPEFSADEVSAQTWLGLNSAERERLRELRESLGLPEEEFSYRDFDLSPRLGNPWRRAAVRLENDDEARRLYGIIEEQDEAWVGRVLGPFNEDEALRVDEVEARIDSWVEDRLAEAGLSLEAVPFISADSPSHANIAIIEELKSSGPYASEINSELLRLGATGWFSSLENPFDFRMAAKLTSQLAQQRIAVEEYPPFEVELFPAPSERMQSEGAPTHVTIDPYDEVDRTLEGLFDFGVTFDELGGAAGVYTSEGEVKLSRGNNFDQFRGGASTQVHENRHREDDHRASATYGYFAMEYDANFYERAAEGPQPTMKMIYEEIRSLLISELYTKIQDAVRSTERVRRGFVFLEEPTVEARQIFAVYAHLCDPSDPLYPWLAEPRAGSAERLIEAVRDRTFEVRTPDAPAPLLAKSYRGV